MIKYTHKNFLADVDRLYRKIKPKMDRYETIYGIPRGGIPLAIELSHKLNLPLVTDKNHINSSTLVVDDVVDSGKTRQRFAGPDFACIHLKLHADCKEPTFYLFTTDEWIEYWWEEGEFPAEDAVTRIIQAIGDNPNRQGVIETPARVVKSWKELYSGYKQEPSDVFKVFEDDMQYGGLVYLRKIEFYSTCEHHLLPFSGEALVAYIPKGPVIGTSKMARLVDLYARRMQMQERIGEQVAEALMKYLQPVGAACLTEAKHLCIACRGVKKQHSIMGYHALKGVFLEQSNAGIAARQELMSIWNKP